MLTGMHTHTHIYIHTHVLCTAGVEQLLTTLWIRACGSSTKSRVYELSPSLGSTMKIDEVS